MPSDNFRTFSRSNPFYLLYNISFSCFFLHLKKQSALCGAFDQCEGLDDVCCWYILVMFKWCNRWLVESALLYSVIIMSVFWHSFRRCIINRREHTKSQEVAVYLSILCPHSACPKVHRVVSQIVSFHFTWFSMVMFTHDRHNHVSLTPFYSFIVFSSHRHW